MLDGTLGGGFSDMHRDPEDPEDEDRLEKLEEEESTAELCRIPRMPHKLNKGEQRVIDDLIDRLTREDASGTANIQDAERRHIGSTRYDINAYGGGPATIPDLCFVEKRKVR
jgi:hypothetical protein